MTDFSFKMYQDGQTVMISNDLKTFTKQAEDIFDEFAAKNKTTNTKLKEGLTEIRKLLFQIHTDLNRHTNDSTMSPAKTILNIRDQVRQVHRTMSEIVSDLK